MAVFDRRLQRKNVITSVDSSLYVYSEGSSLYVYSIEMVIIVWSCKCIELTQCQVVCLINWCLKELCA